MFSRKHVRLVLAVLIIGTLMLTGCGKPAEPAKPAEPEASKGNGSEVASLFSKPIKAKLASEEVEVDPMTVWGNHFADAMDEWSEGKFKIDVFPFGTIGENRDINELCQLGVVELVYSDYAWISSFVPEAQVFGLHYIWPEERIEEVLEWVVRNGDSMAILEECFRREGLVPLSIIYQGWQWITSNNPINSVKDMYGINIRLMGSEMLSRAYRTYGASPTALAYGEIYSALQTGLLDAQVQPCYANKSMGFYEVQNYMTQIFAEPFVGIPTVNMQFFDSLPVEAQEKMREWWIDAIIPEAEWLNKRHEAELAEMGSKIKIVELKGETLNEFKEKGVQSHEHFFELGGPNAKAIYNALVKDIDNAKAALGIN